MTKITHKDVLKDRNFQILWWSMLLSTSATFLLLLAISSVVFEQTGSSFKSSAIFSVHWLLPVLLFPVIGHICTIYCSRRVLIVGEIASAILSVMAGLMFDSFFVGLYGVFLIRGFFESLTKSTRTVALKSSIAPEKLEIAASLFNTSYYLGIGVGSLFGAFVITLLPINAIGIISGSMFLLAATLYRVLPSIPASSTVKETKGFVEQWGGMIRVARQYDIVGYLVFLGVVVAAFQGFHNVARNIFPMDILGLGMPGTSYLQVVNTLGILFGALFVSKYLLRDSKLPQSPEVLIVITACSMLPLAYISQPTLGLLGYFVFAFFFEVAFTKLQNEIVLRCPKEKIGMLSAFNHSVLVGSMMVAVFLMGASVDYVGFGQFATLLSLGIVAAIGSFSLIKLIRNSTGGALSGEAHSFRGE